MKWLFVLLAPSAGTILALQACGGDDSTTGDAGNDVTVSDAPGSDVSQNDGGACPSYGGSIDICKGAVSRCQTCGAGSIDITSCEKANFDAYCNWANTIFSPQFESAFASCATQCDQDAESTCTKSILADASLSTPQQKLVDDYCAKCGTPGCAAAFAKSLNVVEFNDTLVGQMDSKCTPDGGLDSGACTVGYQACIAAVTQAAFAGNPCGDAGGD